MVSSRSPLRRTNSPALAGVRFGFAFPDWFYFIMNGPRLVNTGSAAFTSVSKSWAMAEA